MDRLPPCHMSIWTLKNPETNKIDPQFKIGYLWLPYLKIHRIFRDQVNEMMTNMFNTPTTKYIKNSYNTTIYLILALLMLYECRKTAMYKVLGKIIYKIYED